MRLLMLLLVFQVGYTAVGDAQEIDDAAIEINPLDYVPLEVGNRWTYEHFYMNYLHGAVGLFDVPRYPSGRLPDSLRYVKRIVTIEITHTEVIDGLEYFVFSDGARPFADLMEAWSELTGTNHVRWPPLPDFFWGGKKVRLSDEGFLVFHWNGQDIPVYDFGHTSNPHKYIGTFPRGSGTAQTGVHRVYAQYRLSRGSFSFSYDGIISDFLQGYGVGLTYIYVQSGSFFEEVLLFQNKLIPFC